MKKLIKIFATSPLFALLFIGDLQAFQAASSAAKTGFVDVGDAKLYYEELGTGVPLIMAHGGLLDCSMWDGQFEKFARLFRVVRYDARGDGKSPDVEGRCSNFEDLKKLMDGMGIQKAILMGLSKGGRTAADFAIAHPEMVEAMVLVAPGLSGYPFDSPELQNTYAPLTEAYKKGDSELIVERIAVEVPGARKVVIPGVAHMVNLEKPAESNRIVLDFLAPYARK